MTDDDIEKLTTLVKSGIPVYWCSGREYLKIIVINQKWIEFRDDPNCIPEPAAYLEHGKFIALYSCDIDDFVTFNVQKLFSIY